MSTNIFRGILYFNHIIDIFTNHSFEMQNNDVSVTNVTITDKDCAEIAALAKFFTASTHILCHFHVLKAVDTKLATFKGLSKEQKHEIREQFRAALYARTQAEFDLALAFLMNLGTQSKQFSL